MPALSRASAPINRESVVHALDELEDVVGQLIDLGR